MKFFLKEILKGMAINFVMVRMVITFYQKVVELVERVRLNASLSADLLISIKKSKNQKIFPTKQLWDSYRRKLFVSHISRL